MFWNDLSVVQLFQEKYRTDSTRLKNWDYSQDGFYFITICTQDREEIFGKIRAGKIILNEIGKVVAAEWRRTGEIRANIELDEFVIMPNHLHGIVEISNRDNGKTKNFCKDVVTSRDVARNVSTQINKFSKISPKPGSLSTVVRSFKSAATKCIRQIHPAMDRVWQSRFYDRIIHGEDELNLVRDYIRKNPVNWDIDEENLKFQNVTQTHRSRKA